MSSSAGISAAAAAHISSPGMSKKERDLLKQDKEEWEAHRDIPIGEEKVNCMAYLLFVASVLAIFGMVALAYLLRHRDFTIDGITLKESDIFGDAALPKLEYSSQAKTGIFTNDGYVLLKGNLLQWQPNKDGESKSLTIKDTQFLNFSVKAASSDGTTLRCILKDDHAPNTYFYMYRSIDAEENSNPTVHNIPWRNTKFAALEGTTAIRVDKHNLLSVLDLSGRKTRMHRHFKKPIKLPQKISRIGNDMITRAMISPNQKHVVIGYGPEKAWSVDDTGTDHRWRGQYLNQIQNRHTSMRGVAVVSGDDTTGKSRVKILKKKCRRHGVPNTGCEVLGWSSKNVFVLRQNNSFQACKPTPDLTKSSEFTCVKVVSEKSNSDCFHSYFLSGNQLLLANNKAIYTKNLQQTGTSLQTVIQSGNVKAILTIYSETKLVYSWYHEATSRIALRTVDIKTSEISDNFPQPPCGLAKGTREMRLKETDFWNVDDASCLPQPDNTAKCVVVLSQPFVPPQHYIYNYITPENITTSPVEFMNTKHFDLNTALKLPEYFILANFTMFVEYMQGTDKAEPGTQVGGIPVQFLLPPFREDLNDQNSWRAGQYRLIIKITDKVPNILTKFGNWYDKYIVSFSGAAVIYIHPETIPDSTTFARIFQEITNSGDYAISGKKREEKTFYFRQSMFAEQIERVGYHVQSKGYPIEFWPHNVMLWIQGTAATNLMQPHIQTLSKDLTVNGIVFEDAPSSRPAVFSENMEKEIALSGMYAETLQEQRTKIMIMVQDGVSVQTNQFYQQLRDDFIRRDMLPLYLTYPDDPVARKYKITHISQFFQECSAGIDSTRKGAAYG